MSSFLCHPSHKIYFYYFPIYLLFLLLFIKYFYTCKCFYGEINLPTYLYLKNYSKMLHFFMILLLLFLLPCLNVLSLLLLDVFWPFFQCRLTLWNYLQLVCSKKLQKSTQVNNVTHEIFFQSVKCTNYGSICQPSNRSCA